MSREALESAAPQGGGRRRAIVTGSTIVSLALLTVSGTTYALNDSSVTPLKPAMRTAPQAQVVTPQVAAPSAKQVAAGGTPAKAAVPSTTFTQAAQKAQALLPQADAPQVVTPQTSVLMQFKARLPKAFSLKLDEVATQLTGTVPMPKAFTPLSKPQFMVQDGKIVPIPLPQPVVGNSMMPVGTPTAANTVMWGGTNSGLNMLALPAVAPGVAAPQGPMKFTWPTTQHAVSSQYAMRLHPVLNTWRWHTGSDFALACGSPVVASLPGTVVSAQLVGGNGNRVVVKHANGLYTTYNHLSAFKVTPGMTVAQNQVVGLVGNTGYSTGCHLHYEVLKEVAPGQIYYTQPLNWVFAKPVGVQQMVGVASLVKGGVSTNGSTNLAGALTTGYIGTAPAYTGVYTFTDSTPASAPKPARKTVKKAKATNKLVKSTKRKKATPVTPKPVKPTPKPTVPTTKPNPTKPVNPSPKPTKPKDKDTGTKSPTPPTTTPKPAPTTTVPTPTPTKPEPTKPSPEPTTPTKPAEPTPEPTQPKETTEPTRPAPKETASPEPSTSSSSTSEASKPTVSSTQSSSHQEAPATSSGSKTGE